MKKTNFFVILLLMMVLFLGMISYTFNMHRWRFYLEFIVLIGLLIFAAISILLIYNKINFGYVISAVISLVALLNLIVLYFRTYTSTLLFLAIIASMTAFVVSIVNIGGKKPVQNEQIKAESKPSHVVKTYIPGKVVSSKESVYYHVPTCDWAKKIKKSNQVWFESEDEAKNKGLKPHTCAE